MCKSKGEYEVKIKWLGFDHEGGLTWDPLSVIISDGLDMIEDFLDTSRQRRVKGKILDLFFK